MTKTALPVLQENSLTHYIAEVKKFPMLTEQEEFMLTMRHKMYGDVDAAHKLVTSHLRLVVKTAMAFRGYGLPVHDIIAEGNIGLMHAVKKFDPSKGFRLSTYAMWWIKASIQEFILKSWSIVKVGTSANQKKLFYNLKRMKTKILGDGDANLSDKNISEIAAELDVSAEEVKDMDRLMSSGGQSSLNVNMYEDGEDDKINFIEDTSANQETALGDQQEANNNHTLLVNAMSKLNDREKDILHKRRLAEPPLTLEDLSQEYGISRERVRQIENNALAKLQKIMLPALKAA